MKRMHAVAMALGACAVAGCTGGHEDDARFGFTWDVQYVDKTPASCAIAGTDRVDLDAQHTTTKAQVHFSFPCAGPQEAVTDQAPLGVYSVSVRLRGAMGRLVSESKPVLGEINRYGVTDIGHFAFEVQTFTLAWSLARGGRTVTCTEAGAEKVELTAVPPGGEKMLFEWRCDQGMGETQAVPITTFGLSLRLLGAGRDVLWETTEPMTVEVSARARARLTPVTFNLK
jgi:hypothetical protein